jgi:hypothetical protein
MKEKTKGQQQPAKPFSRIIPSTKHSVFLLLPFSFLLFFYITSLGVNDTHLLAPNTSFATFSNSFAQKSS